MSVSPWLLYIYFWDISFYGLYANPFEYTGFSISSMYPPFYSVLGLQLIPMSLVFTVDCWSLTSNWLTESYTQNLALYNLALFFISYVSFNIVALIVLFGGVKLGEWSLKIRCTKVSWNVQPSSRNQTIYIPWEFWGLSNVVWASSLEF